MMKVNANSRQKQGRFTGFQVLGIVTVVIILTVGFTAWWISQNLYAAPFTPMRLSATEQQLLDSKISKLKQSAMNEEVPVSADRTQSESSLEPEPYREDDAAREINITERELNALIAKDGEMAKYVAIDLADDLISVKLLIPVEEDFPILGGTTLRLKGGAMLSYEHDRPVVMMRGISLGGIPLPKSWWGDIKNKDLVEEFGGTGGFWDQFSKGVEHIKIREGQLWVRLKE